MKQSIKVLWICSWYPSRVYPNSADFVRRQALSTSKLSNITILHAVGDDIKSYEINIEQKDLTTIYVYYPQTQNPILKTIRLFKAQYKGFLALNKIWGIPDIVHLQVLYPAGIFGWFINICYKIPFVVTEHRGGYIHKEGSYRGFFMQLFTKLTVRRAKAVLALSEYFASAMQNHGLSNPFYTVVPNVVDTNRFAPPQYDKLSSGVFRFLHVSMFDDRIKNIGGILRSIAELSKQRSDFVVNIIGDGYDRPKLVALAKTLNILDCFVFFSRHKKAR